MADAIVSVVAEQLVSIITAQIQNEIQLVRGVDKELLDLSDKLKSIRNVLDDADMKQFKEKTVKDWLWRLEQTSYEMEDVLDEWNYAILQHKIESQSQSAASSNRKVCSFVSCSCFSFKKLVVRRDIAKKIQNLKSRLDEILNEKDVYNFVISHPQNDPSPASWRVQSTSLIDLAEVQGRNRDRDILVSKLSANGGGHERLGYRVLSIVGAGGLGKTTLAQLLYNDSQVKECFDLRIWICVSDPFDVAAIAKEIIERIGERSSPDTNQLDALLQGLIQSISGKKILLVLDDVWTEEHVKWEPLQNALKYGGAGSKILVTTRKVKVAEIMGTIDEDIHNLEVLSEEDCWLLLRRLALHGRKKKEFENFEKVGKDIAKKCNGLPLAAKTLGSLLRSKKRVEEWETVLKSEMWGLKEVRMELFPHLLLSYYELSPMLKCCFSYCALFRKGERIEVEILIRLWMASGYLVSNIGSARDEMELGREYFEDLAMRSLFQDFERDDKTDLIVSCKMHDIVHDFAQFLRKNDREEASGVANTSCQVCYPFIVSQVKEYRSFFWGVETLPNHCEYCLKSLRVLKLKWEVNGNLSGIKTLIHLRWLNVSDKRLLKEEVKTICELYFLQTLELDNCDLKEIPREIGNLVKLRHLNLSWNEELKELPESMCSLVELQTLLLESCSLTEIPREIGNLVRLRHLRLSLNGELKELPESMCSLVELQTLELDNCALKEIPREIGNLVKLRHLSLHSNTELKELPESMCSLVELQTLLLNTCSLTEIPREIGNLVKLRHLNLCLNGELKELPESMCSLVELQTLELDNCALTEIPKEIGNLVRLRHLNLGWNEKLKELPESIGNLIKLRHLDLLGCNHELELPESMCNLVELQALDVDGRVLPKGIGELSELRGLKGEFKVGSGHSKLRMLKKLNHLTGSLDLDIKVSSGRDLEELVEDAGEAELKNKIRLQTLTISLFGFAMDESESVSSSLWVDVIEALEPSHKLKELRIIGYAGSRLPHWISSPLNLLTYIELWDLTEVWFLPALGKLPFLEELHMYALKELKVVGGEWLGIKSVKIKDDMTPSSSTTAAVAAFPKLKKLLFDRCEKWEEWEDITAEEEESAALHLMPSLAELSIRFCGRLKMLPHRLLRKAKSLQLLDVTDSSELLKRYEDKDGEAWRSISQIHPQLQLETQRPAWCVGI